MQDKKDTATSQNTQQDGDGDKIRYAYNQSIRSHIPLAGKQDRPGGSNIKDDSFRKPYDTNPFSDDKQQSLTSTNILIPAVMQDKAANANIQDRVTEPVSSVDAGADAGGDCGGDGGDCGGCDGGGGDD